MPDLSHAIPVQPWPAILETLDKMRPLRSSCGRRAPSGAPACPRCGRRPSSTPLRSWCGWCCRFWWRSCSQCLGAPHPLAAADSRRRPPLLQRACLFQSYSIPPDSSRALCCSRAVLPRPLEERCVLCPAVLGILNTPCSPLFQTTAAWNATARHRARNWKILQLENIFVAPGSNLQPYRRCSWFYCGKLVGSQCRHNQRAHRR